MGCRIQRKYGNYKILDYKHINIDWQKENKTGRAKNSVIQVDEKGEQSQNE